MVAWDDYVRPRPERRRGAEVKPTEAANIRANIAAVAIAKVPVDNAVANNYPVTGTELRPLLSAINDLFESLEGIGLNKTD